MIIDIIKKVYRFLSTPSGFLSLAALLCVLLSFVCADSSRLVYIRDGENVSLLKFKESEFSLKELTCERILEEAEIEVSEYDEVYFGGFEGQYAEINIDRANEITVTHDGITEKTYLTQATVREAIESLGVEIGDDDITTMPIYRDTNDGDEITLKRVHFETEVVTAPIEFDQKSKKSSLIKDGRVRVVTEGVDGLKEVATKQMYVDGVLYKEDLVEETVLQSPVDELSIVGSRTAISPFYYENWPLDDRGFPTNYVDVMYNQKCAAYSAKKGAGMASGGKAVVGRVAVNPNIIPYGTKMYLVSPDGESFIYGYCVAGDTGYALMDGLITIDVFFETKKESQIFGIKWLDIYILEWGDNTKRYE